MRKLVAAGNYKQAKYWADQLGWEKDEWTYLYSRRQYIQHIGYGEKIELHYVGTGYDVHPSTKGDWFREISQLVSIGEMVVTEHDPDTGVVVSSIDEPESKTGE